MTSVTSQLPAHQPPALALATGWAPSSYFGGCDRHRDRTDLSCCKIRRADGSPLTTADAWEEIQRLREALKWAEAYVPKRADCETRRMIESLLANNRIDVTEK